MSTIIVALIALTGVIIILLVLINGKKRSRGRLNELLRSFSDSAIKNNLSISGQEVINDSMIGLDAVNRKLLVVNKTKDNLFDNVVIDLTEVEQCKVASVSGVIDYGSSKNSKLDQLLEKIVLRFSFNSGNRSYDFPFYTYNDSLYQLQDLQAKAKQWEAYIKPLLTPAISNR